MMKKLLFLLLLFIFFNDICHAEPLDYWKWRNPLPQANTLRALAFGNNVFVAVGYYGTVVTSEDGFNWTNINTTTSKKLFSITYGNGLFVAVGEGGTVLISRNARVWTTVDSGISQSLYSVAYGMGRFVAVGQRGTIAYSHDGSRWTVVNTITFYNLNGVCHDGNNFYTGGGEVSFFDIKYVLYKSTNLTDWQKVSEGEDFTIMSLSCINDRIYATGVNIDINDYGLFHQTVAISQDSGLTFNIKNLSGKGALYGLTNFRGQRIAIGNNGDIVSSWDDNHWEYRNNPVKNMLFFSLASSDNLIVAVGEKGRIINSINGIDWQEITIGVSDLISDMVYCNNKLTAITQKGTILRSTNGINWSISKEGNGIALNKIICTQHGYMVVGNRGLIMTSEDGIDWIKRDSTTEEPLYDAIYQDNKFFVVGGGKLLPEIPTNIVLTSADGINWRKTFSDIAPLMRSITYGNNKYVATAEYNFVYTSEDGESWNKIMQEEAFLNDITFFNNYFLAVGGEYDLINGGYKGSIMVSVDGVVWNKEVIPDVGILHGIRCVGRLCVSAGENGTVISKTEQGNWIRRLYKKHESFKSVEFFNNSFFVMGHSGAIMQSNTILDDVDENGWSYFHIDRIFKNSITYGCNVFKFCPYRFMTRGEVSAFIIRARYGEDFSFNQIPYFADVSVNHPFFKYVQRLKSDGITHSEGVFLVDNLITRGEMSALLIRALFGEDFTYPSTPYFVDVPPSHPFFKYIQKLKYEGYTTLSQYFDVDGYLTREQGATFISRGFRLLD